MEINIKESLLGTLTNIANLNGISEQETVERIVNDFLTIEFKKELYNKIESTPVDDMVVITQAVDAKKEEILTAKLEAIETPIDGFEPAVEK
jgi:hypothetical protein